MPPVSNTGERVVVAMSGGVDSSVAAAWLIEAGYDVVGVTLHLWDYPDDGSVQSGRCCAPEDQHDARRVADQLGIAHYAFDRRDLFRREVVDPFVDSYLSGSTPSPCVACNRSVKMGELFALADRLGTAKVATGHYARTVTRGDRVELHRGKDPSKDQTIFSTRWPKSSWRGWSSLSEKHKKPKFGRMPCGAPSPGPPKGEPRALFVSTGRYDTFVEEARSGSHSSWSGARRRRAPGGHPPRGSQIYIGQRKGLGVALGAPAFVVGIESDGATVRLGRADDCSSPAPCSAERASSTMSHSRFVQRCKFATGTKG